MSNINDNRFYRETGTETTGGNDKVFILLEALQALVADEMYQDISYPTKLVIEAAIRHATSGSPFQPLETNIPEYGGKTRIPTHLWRSEHLDGMQEYGIQQWNAALDWAAENAQVREVYEQRSEDDFVVIDKVLDKESILNGKI